METLQLSFTEWKTQKTGTRAKMVKTFNGNTGKCVSIDYVLESEDDDLFNSELKDLKAVASGYFTETYNVIKK